MGRVEKFREQRRHRQKCIAVVILFILLTAAGVCTADYRVNTLLKDENRVEVVGFRMDKLYRDFDNLRKRLAGLLP